MSLKNVDLFGSFPFAIAGSEPKRSESATALDSKVKNTAGKTDTAGKTSDTGVAVSSIFKSDIQGPEKTAIDRTAGADSKHTAGSKGDGKSWSGGMSDAVPTETREETARRRVAMFDRMLQSHKIHSLVRVNALIKLHPELRPLADSMIAKWSSIRSRAMEIAVDSIRNPNNVAKRQEFYRHVASTYLPSVELVLALRAQLLPHRNISPEDARDIAVRTHKQNSPLPLQTPPSPQPIPLAGESGPNLQPAAVQTRGLPQGTVDQKSAATPGEKDNGLEEEVIQAVATQLIDDAETLTDIANGVQKNGAPSSPEEKVALSEADRIDHGWMAVQMLDGGQRLVLIEIAAMKDVQRKCMVCHKLCSKRCGRCNSTFYCSTHCQSQDWKNVHQNTCNTLHKSALEELRLILVQDFQPIVITCPPESKRARDTSNNRNHKPKVIRSPQK